MLAVETLTLATTRVFTILVCMLNCSSRHCSLMNEPTLLLLTVCSSMLSPAFLRGYIAMHVYFAKTASMLTACSISTCSCPFPSPLANHLSIKKIRQPWFQVVGDYSLEVNSVHFQFCIWWELCPLSILYLMRSLMTKINNELKKQSSLYKYIDILFEL